VRVVRYSENPPESPVRSLTENARARTIFRLGGVALIAVALVRLALVVPRWLGGAPPAYPDEYVEPLRSALVEIPIVCVAMLAFGARDAPQPLWRRVLSWALLMVSLAAMGLGAGRP
jgi:hypothetical protein